MIKYLSWKLKLHSKCLVLNLSTITAMYGSECSGPFGAHLRRRPAAAGSRRSSPRRPARPPPRSPARPAAAVVVAVRVELGRGDKERRKQKETSLYYARHHSGSLSLKPKRDFALVKLYRLSVHCFLQASLSNEENREIRNGVGKLCLIIAEVSHRTCLLNLRLVCCITYIYCYTYK